MKTYKERRVYMFPCSVCGNARKSFKRSRANKGICRGCRRSAVPENQQTLFPANVPMGDFVAYGSGVAPGAPGEFTGGDIETTNAKNPIIERNSEIHGDNSPLPGEAERAFFDHLAGVNVGEKEN